MDDALPLLLRIEPGADRAHQKGRETTVVKHRNGLQRMKYTAFSEIRSIADSDTSGSASSDDSMVYFSLREQSRMLPATAESAVRARKSPAEQ